jgi:hypothetical protein
MKAVLGCLMCLVLTMSQSFAISGGPFGGRKHVRVTGKYAGILFPSADLACCTDVTGASVPCSDPAAVNRIACPGQPTAGLNQIGLFTLDVPTTGLGTGNVVIFAEALTFSGTIQGVGDPDSAKLTAEIDATSTVTSTAGGVEIAIGNLVGKFKNNPNLFSFASVRLKGKADVQFSGAFNVILDEIIFKVSGFKQAEASQ